MGGSCRDKAGNTGSNAFGLSYDATAPTLSKVEVASRAASALVHWQSTSPADTIVVHRSARGNKADPTVFRGAASSFADKKIQRGLEYVYSLQSYDQAGNASKVVSAVALPKVLTLRKTPYTPRAAANPVLRWDAIRGATYYHVQLFRGKKRILAAWPSSERAHASGGVALGRPSLQARPRPLPLVRVGGHRQALVRPLPDSRQRSLHRPEAVDA